MPESYEEIKFAFEYTREVKVWCEGWRPGGNRVRIYSVGDASPTYIDEGVFKADTMRIGRQYLALWP